MLIIFYTLFPCFIGHTLDLSTDFNICPKAGQLTSDGVCDFIHNLSDVPCWPASVMIRIMDGEVFLAIVLQKPFLDLIAGELIKMISQSVMKPTSTRGKAIINDHIANPSPLVIPDCF